MTQAGALTACSTCGQMVAAAAPPPRIRGEPAARLRSGEPLGAGPIPYPGRRDNKPRFSGPVGESGAGSQLRGHLGHVPANWLQ